MRDGADVVSLVPDMTTDHLTIADVKVIVPWHNPDQKNKFLAAWGVEHLQPNCLLLVQDADKRGCANTKNEGIRQAIESGAKAVVILDDDCFPDKTLRLYDSLEEFVQMHLDRLNRPAEVPLFRQVTEPPSRGTPYHNLTVKMPVAAVMGFWTEVGDYDAVGQLAHGPATRMTFDRAVVHGSYFPLCGMALAFRLDWWPWCRFIPVNRFDDIWQGWLWQKRAYRQGFCFDLGGPLVRHSRQSNVWANLKDEAIHLETNDTLWRTIAEAPDLEYEELLAHVEAQHPTLAGILRLSAL